MATLNQTEQDGLTILTVTGSLVPADLDQIEDSFGRIARQPNVRVVVDLAGVDIVTTPAISMFIAASRTAQRHGGRIVFTQSNPRITDVLHRLRLDSILQTAPEFEQAVTKVKSS